MDWEDIALISPVDESCTLLIVEYIMCRGSDDKVPMMLMISNVLAFVA
jgi:hypothetical protein